MKKLFSLLTLALLTMSAWAQTTVTFDLTAQGYSNQQEVTTLTSGNVTVTFDKGTNNNAPKWYDNGSSVRVYGGSTITVTTTGSDPITGVTFTFGSGDGSNAITSNVGTFESPNWTGSADEVVFTIGGTSGNRRFVQIDVTLGGEVVETLAAPEFSPENGKQFLDSLAISLTCGTTDATISYSTDGLAWQTYTEPFTITETTTVYAKSAKNGKESDVVSATYTKLVAPEGNVIVFNSADDTAMADADEYTVERPGASFTVSNGKIDGSYRIYKDATIVFSSTAGNIVKIEFDNSGGNNYAISNLTTTTGVLVTNGNNGTWIGEAETVTFTASKAQTRASVIRVYVDGDLPVTFVAAPTFNPAACEFEESIDVTINAEDGATIKYNTDGETWMDYNAPIHLTATTTINAKAIKGDVESTVATATYTLKEVAEDITTLAQVNALADNTDFEFKGDAVVTAQEGQYLWVRDESGYGLIFGTLNAETNTVTTFTNGQVLAQGWSAKKTTYNGLTEYKDAAGLNVNGTNAELAAIQTITELSADMINAYVQVLNVKSFTVSGKNVTATLSDGTTMVMYNQFNKEIPTTEGDYTVKGAVGRYAKNSTDQLQLYIISIDGYEPEVYDVNNIAEALALTDNATFTMYNDVVVTYQNGKSLWIRDTDNNSGLIFGTVEGTFENGQVLSDGWTAKKTIYNNVPEFTEPEDVEAAGDETREAAPFERTTITNDNVNEYVILKNITVLTDSASTKRFYNAADSLVLYNQFNLTLNIEDGKNYDVVGIATIYYGKPELYIISATEVATAGKRGDVNLDDVVNIADVTSLIDYLLSGDATGISVENADCNLDNVVNIADVTSLIDYLLSGSWPAE